MHIFSSLKHRDFRILWSSNFAGGASQWAMMVGRAWLVFELTDSALWVAVISFAAFFGAFTMIPFGGTLADRLDRRNILMTSMLMPLVVATALAVITITGSVHIWHVVILALTAGMARALGTPASKALTPNLVPRQDLLNAIAMSSLAIRGPRLIGPLVAAPLLATGGAEWVFLASALFYAVAAVNLHRLHRPPQETVSASRGVIREFLDGVRYLRQSSGVGLMIVFVAIHCSLTMSFEALLPAFAKHNLNAHGDVFGYMVVAVGAGGVLGVLLSAALRGQRIKGQLLLISGILSGLTTVIMGLGTNLPVAFISLLSMGASQAMFMALSEAIIQEVVPDSLRGRVMSIYFMGALGVMAVTTLVNGFLADILGAPILFIAPGLAFVISMGLLSGSRPTLRQVYRIGSLSLGKSKTTRAQAYEQVPS